MGLKKEISIVITISRINSQTCYILVFFFRFISNQLHIKFRTSEREEEKKTNKSIRV